MTDDNPYTYALTADPDKPLREARETIKRLTAERDEARREYCFAFAELTTEPTWEPPTREQAAKRVAKKRGWDCFKEDKPCQ